jgi:hypothetical protein
MATYVLPQVRVFQEATIRPSAESNPQRAFIAGGNAHLVRISEADEKPLGRLGYYDELVDTTYSWPNKPGTSIIDSSYTKLYVENALLHYFNEPASSGSDIFRVSGTTNRIRAATINFATNNGYARSAGLYSRDVQPGDIVRVRGTPTGSGGGDPVTLWTYVKAVEPDRTSESYGTPSAATSNAATTSASTTAIQLSGAENWIEISADGAAYDGTPAGKTQETYIIRVMDSSTGGDFTTASLRVLSASGTDDQVSVTPAAAGSPTTIGTRGLTVTFDVDAVSESLSADWDAEVEGFTSSDLIAGQEFRVVVTQDFTARSISVGSGGSYAGATDTTYIVEVVKGGTLASGPQIMVTTTDGTDQSGPHVITADNTNISIGTQGVRIKFDTVLLAPSRHNKGDKFYLPVSAASSGPIKTLVLGKSLPASFETTDDLGIDLYIRKSLLEIPSRQAGTLFDENWEQTDANIMVRAGLTATDDTLHDNGVPISLDIYSNEELGYGVLYTEYRAWLQDLASSLNVLYDVSEIDLIPGKDTFDNPLKFNARVAISNSNGAGVTVAAVGNPDSLDSWGNVLELAGSRDDVYGLVPLTDNAEVFDLFQGHVNSLSSPSTGLWRSCWFPLAPIPTLPVVHAGTDLRGYGTAVTTDGEVALGQFEETSSAPAEHLRLRVPAANANFITNGVRPGDIVRHSFGDDGFGNVIYNEYVVDTVESESVLYTVTGPAAADDIPIKVEIWRTLTASEQAVEIGKVASSYNSWRVCAVWAEALEPQYTITACAALAGLASGVLPQQGLTNVTVSGLSAYVRNTGAFSVSQLNDIAVRGGWIVYQTIDGDIITRHAVTTGDYEDVNQREEMVRRNFDNISYRVRDFFSPYIGVTNVTPGMESQIRTDFDSLTLQLQNERTSPRTGPQLLSLVLTRFETSNVFRDRYIVQAEVQLPYPLNNLDIYLVLV